MNEEAKRAEYISAFHEIYDAKTSAECRQLALRSKKPGDYQDSAEQYERCLVLEKKYHNAETMKTLAKVSVASLIGKIGFFPAFHQFFIFF